MWFKEHTSFPSFKMIFILLELSDAVSVPNYSVYLYDYCAIDFTLPAMSNPYFSAPLLFKGVLINTPTLLVAITAIQLQYSSEIFYYLNTSSPTTTSARFIFQTANPTSVLSLRVRLAGTANNSIIYHGFYSRVWNGDFNNVPGNNNNFGKLIDTSPSNRNVNNLFQPTFPGRNTSNTVVTLLFDNGMHMYANGGSPMGVKLTVTSPQGNKFNLAQLCVSSTTLVQFSLAYLNYQVPEVQQNFYRTFSKVVVKSATIASDTDVVINSTFAFNESNVLMGLTYFTISSSSNLKFSIAEPVLNLNMDANFTLTDFNPGKQLSYSLFMLVKLNCSTPPDLFLSFDRTACLSGCPIMFYPNAYGTCVNCFYSCYTCSNGSNICNSCNFDRDHRLMNPQNLCLCTTSFYDTPSFPQCFPCHYSCLFCSGLGSSGPSYCLGCAGNYSRTLNQTSCPCDPGFYDNGRSQCQLCHFTCKTCDNSDTQCTSCNTAYFRQLTTSDTCVCMYRYFEGQLPACLACHTTCLTCNGNQDDMCLTCDGLVNRVLQGTVCVCAYNFFSNALNICQACHISCLNCTGSLPSQCLSCYDFSMRSLVGSSCLCNVRYYDNSVRICASCHYSCQYCLGPAASQCSSCALGWFRSLSSTSCPCINKYFDAGISICQSCFYTCLTCSALSTCITCDPIDAHRQTPASGCPCMSGFFQAGISNCGVCDITCLTCTGAGPSNCSSCDGNVFRSLVVTSCPCMTNFYTSKGLCNPCHYSCMTCASYGVNLCSSCDSGNKRQLINNNTCSCLLGFFDQGLAACTPCFSQCQSCAISKFNCLSCLASQNRLLETSNSTCYCKPGYVQSGADVCPNCISSCLACLSLPEICIACDLSNFRYFHFTDKACYCIQKYFDNAGTCQPCHPSCLTCTGNLITNCLSCNPDRLLSLGQCLCFGNHYSISVSTCGICDVTCQTCSAPLSSSCLSCSLAQGRTLSGSTCICSQGFYLDLNQVCALCQYYCNSCSSDYICLSCSAAMFRFLSGQTCLCISGYFDNFAALCQACSYTCLTCNADASFCLSCHFTRFLRNSMCPCLPGYFDTGLKICQKCSTICLTCFQSANNCFSCDALLFRQLKSNSCPCMSRYYDTGVCLRCHPTCLTCTSSSISSCLTCDTTANFYLSTSNCFCIDGFYLFVYTCEPCHQTCKTCFQGTSLSCLSCLSGYILVGSSCLATLVCPLGLYSYKGFCLANCPPGWYADIGGTCKSCQFQCTTCITATCLSCISGYFLQSPGCVPKCTANFYLNGSLCLPCSTGCLQCQFNSVQVYCMQCVSPLLYLNQSCVAVCPRGYVNVIKGCQKCSPQCAVCFGTSRNQCSHCINNYILVGNSCEACQPGMYWFYTSTCQPCYQTCSTCSSVQCFSCFKSKAYLSEKGCAPYGFFFKENQLEKCYSTCHSCRGQLSSDCLTCRIGAGQMGLPANGYCKCHSSTVAVYEGGCSNSTGLVVLRALAGSTYTAGLIVAAAISLVCRQASLVQSVMYSAQQIRALDSFSNRLSGTMDQSIRHFQAYGPELMAQRQFYFKRMLLQNNSNVLWIFLVLVGVIVALELIWRLVLILLGWQDSIFQNNDLLQRLTSLHDRHGDMVISRLLFLLGPNILFTALQTFMMQLMVSSISIITILTLSVYVTYRIGKRIILQEDQISNEWLTQDFDSALTTLKGKIFVFVWYWLRIMIAGVLGWSGSVQTGYLVLGIGVIQFFYFYKFNPFRSRVRNILLALNLTFILLAVLILAIVQVQSSQVKAGLSVFATVSVFLCALWVIVQSLLRWVKGEPGRVQDLAVEGRGQELETYWASLDNKT